MPIRETLPFFRQSVEYGILFRDSEYLGYGATELCGMFQALQLEHPSELIFTFPNFSAYSLLGVCFSFAQNTPKVNLTDTVFLDRACLSQK